MVIEKFIIQIHFISILPIIRMLSLAMGTNIDSDANSILPI